ncbi:MAG: DUF6768 family protein [Myxococcota bacterium]
MSQLEDLIRDALQNHDPDDAGEQPLAGQVADHFLRRSRWVAAFAWMKMGGTLTISIVAAVFFFGAETTRAQIAFASIFLTGFVGFAMWWLWYWMVLNRNAALREMKRIELQIAELRDPARESA